MSGPALQLVPPAQARMLAQGLGWFSIALGLSEILAPGAIKRSTGAPAPKAVLQFYGLREIATGLAILGARDPNKMVWARVAGDLVDLATLAPALSPGNPQRTGGAGALGFVALATVLDVVVALHHGEEPQADDGYEPQWGGGPMAVEDPTAAEGHPS